MTAKRLVHIPASDIAHDRRLTVARGLRVKHQHDADGEALVFEHVSVARIAIRNCAHLFALQSAQPVIARACGKATRQQRCDGVDVGALDFTADDLVALGLGVSCDVMNHVPVPVACVLFVNVMGVPTAKRAVKTRY